MRVGVGVEVGAEQLDQEGGQGDGAGGLGGLGWAQFQAAAGFVQCPDIGVDHDGRVVEVGVGAVQTDELPPAGTGPRRGDDQRRGGRAGGGEAGGVVGHREHLLWGRPDPFHPAGGAVPTKAAGADRLATMSRSSTASDNISDSSFVTPDTVTGA